MKETARVVEIGSDYNLRQVFNAINQEASNIMFYYHGITFWREDNEFMTENAGTELRLGEIVDFDDFKQALGIKNR